MSIKIIAELIKVDHPEYSQEQAEKLAEAYACNGCESEPIENIA